MNNFAIIVAYNPKKEALINLCKNLTLSDLNVIIIDNTEYLNKENYLTIDLDKCKVIVLGSNVGIAKAQNIGIQEAISQDANCVVFFDQDSIVENGLIEKLMGQLEVGKPSISAPVSVDKDTLHELPSFLITKYGLINKVYSEDKNKPYKVDLCISSGTAVTMETFVKVGFMDEDYFIDFVDFDWCFRCKLHNIPIYIVQDAIMKHKIGESDLKFGKVKITIHSAPRTYYKIRNTFLLLGKKHVPMLYALKQILAVYSQQIIAIFKVKSKKPYIKAFIRGTFHGLRQKKGKDI